MARVSRTTKVFLGALAAVVVIAGLSVWSNRPVPPTLTPDDVAVQRVTRAAIAQDQATLSRILVDGQTSCPATNPTEQDTCELHTLLVGSVHEGFNLAMREAATHAHRPVPTEDDQATAWSSAKTLPVNQGILAGEASLQSFRGVCPTLDMACVRPKAVVLGLGVGVRVFRNAQRAGQLALYPMVDTVASAALPGVATNAPTPSSAPRP